MQQIVSHHKRERSIEDSSIKEQDDDYVQQLKKVATSSSRKRINDFKCQAFFQGHIFDFQLSQLFFQSATYAVLFFCPYDLYSSIVFCLIIIADKTDLNFYLIVHLNQKMICVI